MTERSTNPPERGPHGRNEVTEALLRATAQLCEHRLPSSVSIRDVACEARVTPGLVYHYYESKDDLLRATVDALAADVAAEAEHETDPAAMVRRISRYLFENPALPRIVAWMTLEGRTVSDEMSGHPFLELLAASVAENHPGRDAPERLGVVAILLLSTGLLAPGMNETMHRDKDDQRLLEALSDTLARVVIGDTDPRTDS